MEEAKASFATVDHDSAEIEGLWIDHADSLKACLPGLAPDLQSQVRAFADQGYVILPGLVPETLVDEILRDVERTAADPHAYVVRNNGLYVDIAEQGGLAPADRIIDLYGVSAAARAAIQHPTVTRLLGAIFDAPPIAMQSLSFTYGSQQGVHQDTAYVISRKPLHLAAIWIALEDVKPGAGELIYYPYSHRFDHFLFGGEQKGWEKKSHGVEQHMQYLKQLHSQARQRNIPLQHFYAKKGDVFVWHADLAHGGAKASLTDHTRKSLVAHYCPMTVKPKYHNVVGEAYHEYEVRHDTGDLGYFTSRHYRLEELKDRRRASIYYDGGVTKRRQADG